MPPPTTVPTVSTTAPDWPAAVAAALRRRPARAGAYRAVAIEGRSGSGKTRTAGLLAEALGGAPVIHLDDLYPGWEGLAAAAPLLLRWVLEPLARGEAPQWRRYDWERGVFGPWRRTRVDDLLLVEGCGAGAAPLRPLLSALVWVDAPAEARSRRLRTRADAAAYAPHMARWARQEAVFYRAHRPREHADLLIDNPLTEDPQTEDPLTGNPLTGDPPIGDD
ncbi:uridine kinase family protein [Murinocardiopsis flavida]|uniref:uridine kinase family protein n=1 Tax=Murinocardiopsis flavida TaxID=645275 RepID=UPI001B802A74|nr:hypothetical protein [Murinocardiopsis flavida]